MVYKKSLAKSPKTQTKTVQLDAEMRKHVFEKPDFLGEINSRTLRGMMLSKLAFQLKYISSDVARYVNECVIYDLAEFREKFVIEGDVRKSLATIRLELGNRGIKRLRTFIDEELQKIYFWTGFKLE